MLFSPNLPVSIVEWKTIRLSGFESQLLHLLTGDLAKFYFTMFQFLHFGINKTYQSHRVAVKVTWVNASNVPDSIIFMC